jgi:hypothetical protein
LGAKQPPPRRQQLEQLTPSETKKLGTLANRAQEEVADVFALYFTAQVTGLKWHYPEWDSQANAPVVNDATSDFFWLDDGIEAVASVVLRGPKPFPVVTLTLLPNQISLRWIRGHAIGGGRHSVLLLARHQVKAGGDR